jgi:hypothetical protein
MEAQLAGMTIIIFSPKAFSANLIAMAAPHPGHPRCPGLK